jgi:hypothetical protein
MSEGGGNGVIPPLLSNATTIIHFIPLQLIVPQLSPPG